MTFTTQIYQNLQNVNKDNMNLFYDDKDQKLSGYFNQVPCIASGVGNITANFGQIGTTNQFVFTNGVIRFSDQATPLGSSIETIFTDLTGSTVTVTASSSPPAQLYVVAVLTMTPLDAFKVENTVAISTTAMTLADIAGETNPLAYLPLFAITNTAGVYSIFVDSNCAFNYYYIQETPIPHGQVLFDTAGSHSFVIPANVTKIYITASGAGGGGAAGNSQLTYCMSGGGGSGGQSVFKDERAVTPLTTLAITVGSKGIGGTTNGHSGNVGGTTQITGLIPSLSLLGGQPGGNSTFITEAYRGGIGPVNGISGGIGNTIISSTFTGALSGGDGGGSIFGGGGNGGGGNGTPGDALDGTNGKLGGGGGGGGAQNNSSGTDFSNGGDGGDGFVLIEY